VKSRRGFTHLTASDDALELHVAKCATHRELVIMP
jgi:hypothetical protein